MPGKTNLESSTGKQYNCRQMQTTLVRLRNPRLLNAAVYGIVILLAGVSAFTALLLWAKAAILALCLAFCLVHAFGFSRADTPGRLSAYFIIQGIIILALLRLSASSDTFVLFLYILALEAATVLLGRHALAWIAGFYLLASLNMLWNQGTGGVLVIFFYAAAFLLTAVCGSALRQTEIARRKNEELLEELKTTQRQLQDLAVIGERNRMAREMHDSLGHRLTVSIVQLEGAQRLIPTDPERAARMVGTMRDEMKEALAELRRTVSALRAPLPADHSLDSVLSTLSQTFEQSTGIPTHFTFSPGFPELTEAHQLAFYRMSQEGLTNIQRHAMAQNAWVELKADDQNITLLIEDDGQGFSTRSENRAGSGLIGLRERAAQLNGEMQIIARQGGGTQLIITVPLPNKGFNP
jgi:signal transduction histidine kinase